MQIGNKEMNYRIGIVALLAAITVPGFAQLEPKLIASGLINPIGYYADPVDPTYAYVVQQSGEIRTLIQGVIQPENFLTVPPEDIGPWGEQGLLGFVFHRNYKTNHFAYIYYARPDYSLQISRYTLSTTSHTLDPASRYDIITIQHPVQHNHNGATLRFGRDGFLYLGLGDGGGQNDPYQNAQNLNSLLGKIIRLDINKDDFPDDPTRNYAIPKTNPFRETAGVRPEIFAYGLRNPYKYSFDRATGDMDIGDVGQKKREEIDVIPFGTSGQNFGWRSVEGDIDNPNVDDDAPPNAVAPLYAYNHGLGHAITGGYVYRGKKLGAAYVGRYFFADYIRGRLWSIDPTATDPLSSRVEYTAELGITGVNYSSIDETGAGELILVDRTAGNIYRLALRKP
ncbi:hypothetical protein BH11ARM1_BH11ARM1_07420 [soil metagenome]